LLYKEETIDDKNAHRNARTSHGIAQVTTKVSAKVMLKVKSKHMITSKRKRKGLPCQFTTNAKLTSRNTKENVRFMVPDASGIQKL